MPVVVAGTLFRSVSFLFAREIRPGTVFGNVPKNRSNRIFDEHISTEGEWITSRGQRRALMAKNGLDYKHKKQPRPGSTIFFDMGRR